MKRGSGIKGEPAKRRLSEASANTWIGFLLIILSAASLGVAIWQSFSRELTGLEATLFSSITFILSSFGSFIVSAHFSHAQAKKEYQQLARPALRRVMSLESALALVADRVKARIDSREAGNADELVWLEGVNTQLQLLSHTIRDATSDWHELLPADYEDALRRANQEREDSVVRIERLSKEIEEQKAKHQSGDRASQERITALENQLSKAKSDAASVNVAVKPLFGMQDKNYTFEVPTNGIGILGGNWKPSMKDDPSEKD